MTVSLIRPGAGSIADQFAAVDRVLDELASEIGALKAAHVRLSKRTVEAAAAVAGLKVAQQSEDMTEPPALVHAVGERRLSLAWSAP